MVRKEQSQHKFQTALADNPAKDVSRDEWNDDHDMTGMQSNDSTTATITISAGALLVTDTLTIIAAESGTADDLANITTTNMVENDVLLLMADAGDTITVKDAAGGAGQIHLNGDVDRDLTQTTALWLIQRGADLYEYNLQVEYSDALFTLHDDGDATKKALFQLSGITTTTTRTYALPDITATLATTPMGEPFDMNGNDIILDVAGNISIDSSQANITILKHSTNFPNFSLLRDQIVGDGSTAGKIPFKSKDDAGTVKIFAEIKAMVEDTTVAGNLVHGSLQIRVMDTNVVTNYMNFNDAKSGQIDVLKPFGDFDVTIKDNRLKINNPADTFAYTFVADAIGAARNINLPLLTDNITLGDRESPLIVAAGDETTVLSIGTAKITFRMPFAMTLTNVKASLTTAGTGAALVTVDINEGGATILSTKITIDATEKTSETAATPPVISDTSLAVDAEMTVDIDTIDTDNVATGLKITLVGYKTP